MVRAREDRNRLEEVKREISRIWGNWADNYLNTITIYYLAKSVLRAVKRMTAVSASNRLN